MYIALLIDSLYIVYALFQVRETRVQVGLVRDVVILGVISPVTRLAISIKNVFKKGRSRLTIRKCLLVRCFSHTFK